MRILLDQGVYDLRNKGNVALLQVALRRLHGLCPHASFEVITSAPHLLRLYCPNASPVSPDLRRVSVENRSRFDVLAEHVPVPMLRFLFEAREEAWHRWPSLGSEMMRTRIDSLRHAEAKNDTLEMNGDREQAKDQEPKGRSDLFEALKGIDLLVATGAQYMSDACRDDALRVLDRLEAANQLGIPTAMVGQGLGPFNDSELRARARAVLPLVDLIFIRDRIAASPLLASLRVDPSHVVFTGDDAIEMAYEAHTPVHGSAIGVSLRMAHYTQVGSKHVEILRSVLKQAVLKHPAKLLAVPISHSIHERDDQVIQQLLNREANVSNSQWRFDTPQEIIKKVGRCRLVVTGAFHTAVFALAQGIPAVGLAKSVMYKDKFLSLVDQFGPGCQLVYLDDQCLQEKLLAAIDTAWDSAEQVRPQLLEAAVQHIKLGHTAYQRLYELAESKKQLKPCLTERTAQWANINHA